MDCLVRSMKKLSILSVLLCLLLCFSGCGLTVTEQENTGTQAAAVTEPSTTTVSQSAESVSMPSATSAASTSVAAQTSTTSAASSAASAAVGSGSYRDSGMESTQLYSTLLE